MVKSVFFVCITIRWQTFFFMRKKRFKKANKNFLLSFLLHFSKKKKTFKKPRKMGLLKLV